MKKIVLFSITFSLLISCTNEINRSQAEELLKSEIGYPYVEYRRAKWDIWCYESEGKYIVSDPNTAAKNNIKTIVDKGLINITNGTKIGRSIYNRTPKNIYKYSLSNKSRNMLWGENNLESLYDKYWLADLPMYEIEITEITGITYEDEKKTKAIIEFTEKISKKSPFTQIAIKSDRPNTIIRTAKIELYDDGWRITSSGLPEKIKKKKPENVDGWSQLF